eukprot:344438_1
MGKSGSKDKTPEEILTIEECADAAVAHLAKHAKSVPALAEKYIKDIYPKANNAKKILIVYKALIPFSEKQMGEENTKFLHAMHVAKQKYTKNGQCTAELKTIFEKFVKTGVEWEVNVGDERIPLTKAYPGFISPFNDPGAGSWKKAEDEVAFNVADLLRKFTKTEIGKKYTAGKVAYDNQLSDFNDEYYDNYEEDYQLEAQKANAYGSSYYIDGQAGGYNTGRYNGHGYNIGYKRGDKSGVIDPTLMLLIGLMFCLC